MPDNPDGRAEDTKEGLRVWFMPGSRTRLEFDNLLVAHGDPIVGGAREELRRFASSAAGLRPRRST